MITPFSHKATLAMLIGVGTITAAGAAGIHRLAVTQGTGSNGATNFLNTSVSNSALEGNVGTADTTYTTPFALFGAYDDTADSTFGIGVLGASTNGYGVAGVSNNDSQPSILAYPGGNGIGLEATTLSTSTQPAIYSEAKGSGVGVQAVADGPGIGGIIEAKGAGPGLIVEADSGGDSVEALTGGTNAGEAILGRPTGEGVAALGYSGNATHPALSIIAERSGTDFIGATNPAGAKVFEVQAGTADRSGGALAAGADVQVSGDLFVYGHIFQDCGAYPAVSGTNCFEDTLGPTSAAVPRPSTRGNVTMYHSVETLPTVEDVGSGHMAYGRSFVRLDPAFAATMSQSAPYMVLVTPRGDSRGVYVTNTTLAGFEVHENASGRSTMDFDYRIVAKPLADNSARLAAVAPEHKIGERSFRGPVSSTKTKPNFARVPPISPAFVRSIAVMHATR